MRQTYNTSHLSKLNHQSKDAYIYILNEPQERSQSTSILRYYNRLESEHYAHFPKAITAIFHTHISSSPFTSRFLANKKLDYANIFGITRIYTQ